MPSEMLCWNCTLDNGLRTKEKCLWMSYTIVKTLWNWTILIQHAKFGSVCVVVTCFKYVPIGYWYDGHWLYGNFEMQSVLAMFSAGSLHSVWAHNFDNGHYSLDVGHNVMVWQAVKT